MEAQTSPILPGDGKRLYLGPNRRAKPISVRYYSPKHQNSSSSGVTRRLRGATTGVEIEVVYRSGRHYQTAAVSATVFENGGPDVVTYGDLIREYARQKALRRWLISVPILTPYLSGRWLALVTPAAYEVGRHLIEGLKNSTVVWDKKALEVFSIRPMGVKEAIQKAITNMHE
jgi:hypothetical protein